MMLVALLVVALVCLAVGLVLPSVAWLIASLIATAGAGYLLVKARSTILAPRPAGGSPDTGADTGDGIPAATDAPVAAGSAPAETTVLPRLGADLVEADAPAQGARTGHPDTSPPANGSTADGDTGSDPGAGAPSFDDYQAGPDDVWVIDGRPRYHVRKCVIIQGQDAEPIPFDQAVEDGFMPCSLCEPQLARAAARDL